VIGHSSGAVAALCLAQQQPVAGIVIVAGYDDPMGDELEASSGYFDEEFNWAQIQANAGFIIQFAGTRDRLVPIEVQRRVAERLSPKVRFVELATRDHFFTPPFPEMLQELLPILQSLRDAKDTTPAEAGAGAGAGEEEE
jgi:pimeloyl-ACP methyl ester carboxylesterase